MIKAFWDGFWCGANPLVALAWIVFWVGHLCSLVLNRCDSEFWCGFWYAQYNRLMGWSLKLQGNSRCGPWRTP